MTFSYRLPANIDHSKTACLLFLDFPPMTQLIEEGWTFYAVDQTRGRCRHNTKTITIPCWAFATEQEAPGYLLWYLAHECAHAIAGPFAKHGPLFMEALKRICPAHCIHYELGYKPRNAMAAGIRQQDQPFDLDL